MLVWFLQRKMLWIFFALQRTSEGGQREGIEAKSQERFLRYFAVIAFAKGPRKLPRPSRIMFKSIRIHGVKALGLDPRELWFHLYQGLDGLLYDHKSETDRKTAVLIDTNKDYADFVTHKPLVLCDDIRVCFYAPKKK